jgi:hypothetical protein
MIGFSFEKRKNLTFNPILFSSHLRLDLLCDPFPSSFATKTLYTFVFAPHKSMNKLFLHFAEYKHLEKCLK